MKEKSQFSLLGERRFGPFFLTQFLGAFNDNVFKNALIVMIAFQASATMGVSSDILMLLRYGWRPDEGQRLGLESLGDNIWRIPDT